MNYADEAIYSAIREAELLRKRTRKKAGVQVKGVERDIIRATALAWFNNHRKKLIPLFSDAELSSVDELYKRVIDASHRSTLRSNYLKVLKAITEILSQLRSVNVLKISNAPPPQLPRVDVPPNFSPLIQDPQMKAILQRRWVECTACIDASAPLAAIVMMGGLLEGLLLARVNREPNKAPIFTSSSAPKDRQGKTLVLKEWTLQNYIDVAHELHWISQTVRDIGEVLRDYRNYIHPQKEFSEKITLRITDAALLWEISKNIAKQLLTP